MRSHRLVGACLQIGLALGLVLVMPLQSSAQCTMLDCPVGYNIILGTAAGETINGTSGSDCILGMGGDDVINGMDGDDYICGDDGLDTIDAGPGNDVVYGGAGNDVILGQTGVDTLNGGDDVDVIRGGNGNDTINGDAGNDTLIGGPGNDTINGGGGSDTMFGRDGDDILNGDGGADIMDGENGNDTLDGGLGANDMSGSLGNDTLIGGANGEILRGGDGNDIINGNGGPDTILGGPDDDTITGGTGNDIISGGDGIETISGNDGVDTIDGDDGNDILNGNLGADVINGGEGDDTINGGDDGDTLTGDNGNDTINGDNGNDFIYGSNGDDILSGGAGNDEIRGEDGNDMINGDAGDDLLIGSTGGDTINGGDGNDDIRGQAGVDILRGDGDNDTITGGDDDDLIDGGGGIDNIMGEDGDDVINGGDGADIIDGGNGLDTINGDDGNDDIVGGPGPDIINGGLGDDTLKGGPDNDTIDGQDGTDSLDGSAGFDACRNGETTINCELFTRLALASTRGWRDGSSVVFEWETSSESSTIGFYVSRLQDGALQQVHQGILPAEPGALRGALYRVRDLEAPSRQAVYTYYITEVIVGGAEVQHGPFQVRPALTAQQLFSTSVNSVFARTAHLALQPRLRKADGPALSGDADALFVGVDKLGFYAVKAEDLAAALGLDVSVVQEQILAGEFSVTTGGEELAWQAAAAGSELRFLGEESHSLFTKARPYRIAPVEGLQIQQRVAAPADDPALAAFDETVRAEEDLIAAVVIGTDPREDYWYWQQISASPSMPLDAEAVLNLEEPMGGGQLRLAVHGLIDTQHEVQVYLNDQLIGQHAFSGVEAREFSTDVPEGVLESGENTVRLTDTGASNSIMFLNYVELTYSRAPVTDHEALGVMVDGASTITVNGLSGASVRVFDVSDAKRPVELTGLDVGDDHTAFAGAAGRYYVLRDEAVRAPVFLRGDYATSLHAGDNRGEYLIITHADFMEGANSLREYRASQGLQAKVVDIQDVFDEFGHGVSDPQAIKDFLTHAVLHWAVAPEYVVLVGKGSLDYRDIQQYGGNFVPPMLAPTENGLFASDTSLADFDGNDGLPDIAIGRLPVTTNLQLQDLVNQIEAYEQALNDRPDRALLLADRDDRDGNFSAAWEQVASDLEGWELSRVYRSELGSAEETREAFFGELVSAPRLVSYLGHAGITRLGGSESLLAIEDVEAMSAGPQQPIFGLMTCLASRYEVPGLTSLGETLVLDAEAAIAVWAPSGESIHDQARDMGETFFALLKSGDEDRLGKLINLSYETLEGQERSSEMFAVYHLLGDPGLLVRKAGDDPDPGDPDPGDPGPGADNGKTGGCTLSQQADDNAGVLWMLFGLALLARRRRR